jgi:hypothetical protein
MKCLTKEKKIYNNVLLQRQNMQKILFLFESIQFPGF